MATTTVAPHAGRREAASAGSALTGVGTLLRLALRRDRVRLSVWVAALTLMMVYAPNAVKLAYPGEEQRLARVNLLKTPAGMMLGGPMFGGNETDLGAMMANELMLTLIIAASIMSILTVIRHTRAEEESGTAELVMSSVVGRYARTFAALVLIGGVNAVLAVTMTIAMSATGFRIVDTAAMSLGITGVSMLFGTVAAVTAQLWRQARTATGAAMGVLAVAVLVRGVGDVINNSGSALSWFSPIAWAQQMRAFVDLRWWPLAMLVALTITLMLTAAVLEVRREYDDGNLPSSGDHPNARNQECLRAACHAAAGPDDRLGRGFVRRGLGIRVDDEVTARRGQRQRAHSARNRPAGHRQHLHHNDAIPCGCGNRVRRRRRTSRAQR
jgi:ABC-2 type transport system permease protein